MTVVGAGKYCYGGPDCDVVPAEMPVPVDAHVEGSSDLTCDAAREDCHLLVVDRDENKLYELYQATKVGEEMTAAGFPIAAMTPTADEVASGEITHALRFILPNDRMREGVYVAPATHASGPKNTDPNAPPYGVRFRF